MGKTSAGYETRRNFLREIALIAACLALNLLLSFAGRELSCRYFPLYLDCAGTALAAMLGGALPAVIVGFATNLIGSLFGTTVTFYFGTISVIIALVVRYLFLNGFFCKVWKFLVSVLIVAVVCSALSSILVWTIYGFSYGSEVAGPFAELIGEKMGFSPFLSLLTAQFLVNLFDKLIVLSLAVLLFRLCPARIKAALNPGTDNRLQGPFLSNVRSFFHSLPGTVVRTMVLFEVALCVLVSGICYFMYREANIQKYSGTSYDATEMAKHFVDPDTVDFYLADRERVFDEYVSAYDVPAEAAADPYNEEYNGYFDNYNEFAREHYSPEYLEAEDHLRAVGAAFSDLEYLYIYRVEEDGCHVVFDIDETACAPFIEFDESFLPLVPTLLGGEEIDPIITDDTYGWLLTVYSPLRSADGECQAYVCADISMTDLRVDQMVFIIKVVTVLVGASLVVLVAVLNIFEHKLVNPINSISAAAREFAFDENDVDHESLSRLTSLDIRSCVEVEQLYDSLKKLAADSVRYIERIRADAEAISKMQDAIIADFANMVESRDQNTGDHIKKTSYFVGRIAEQLRRDGVYADVLTDEYIETIVRSAPLHDIGKITVSDLILNKPGRLTDEEYEIMKTHAEAGAEILTNASVNSKDNDYLAEAINMARYHHEWWNGKGYSAGIAGEEIPLSARIMAVADVFDALTSKRSYKGPFPFDKSIAIIREESGTHFDPKVVDAFLEIAEDFREPDAGGE